MGKLSAVYIGTIEREDVVQNTLEKAQGGTVKGDIINKRGVVGGGIMSTVEGVKTETATIPSLAPSPEAAKRGPKHRRLPEDLIKQLSRKDMGSKAIAAKLKRDKGIKVSYKTIQRVLSGERKQLAFPI